MKNRLLVTACVVALAGCLMVEQTQTIYLEADGSVTWSSIETLVRSDEEDPVKRDAEENEFLTAAYAGKNATAEMMRELGGYGVTTRVTRTVRPYEATTEGHFKSIEALLEAQVAKIEGATVEVKRDGPVTRVTVRVADGSSESGDAAVEEPKPLKGFRIALARGRFIDAKGFVLSKDGAVAEPLVLKPSKGVIVYELAWTTAEVVPQPQ